MTKPARPRPRHYQLLLAAAVSLLAGACGAGAHKAPSASKAPGTTGSAAASTATPTTAPATGTGIYGPTAAWVTAENAKPGTTAWQIKGTPPGTIAGFLNQTSAEAGQQVTMYVTTDAATFTVDAYRMGWYGGAGARLVWSSPAEKGTVQPPCPVTPGVNMVSCDNWAASLTIPITPSFVQGDYLFELVGAGGQRSYVPLTVTDTASHAALLVKNDVYTWQAWNPYGGFDFYQGQGACQPSYPPCNRARVVSYDRPYGYVDGAGDFLDQEYPLIRFMERYGLDVTYTTDIQVDSDPAILGQHMAILSLGHDECWSLTERQAVQQAATTHGLNVAYFGASPMLRHVRPQASAMGPDREVVDYRDSTEDPLNGHGNPLEVTGNTWNSPPSNWDEVPFVGSEYTGYVEPGRPASPMVVTDPGSWIYKGITVTAGQSVPGLISGDFDQYAPGVAPSNVEILAHSPVLRSTAQTSTAAPASDVTYYTLPGSRAGIFDTGSTTWIPSMDGSGFLQTMTGNLFAVIGSGPAGVSHPSTGNWQSIYH